MIAPMRGGRGARTRSWSGSGRRRRSTTRAPSPTATPRTTTSIDPRRRRTRTRFRSPGRSPRRPRRGARAAVAHSRRRRRARLPRASPHAQARARSRQLHVLRLRVGAQLVARKGRTRDARLAALRPAPVRARGRRRAARRGRRFEPRRGRMDPPAPRAGPGARGHRRGCAKEGQGPGHDAAVRRRGGQSVAETGKVRPGVALRAVPRAPRRDGERRGAPLGTRHVDEVLGCPTSRSPRYAPLGRAAVDRGADNPGGDHGRSPYYLAVPADVAEETAADDGGGIDS